MIAASIYILHEIMDLVVIWFLISHAVYAAYLYVFGTKKWWLALLPFGVTIVTNVEMATLPMWVNILHVITSLLALLAPLPCFFVYRAILYKRDYDIGAYFAWPNSDMSQAKWAFIPMYRYVYMIKLIMKGGKLCA